MPAIITIHMAQRSSRCGASHVAVIIQPDDPVMGPYMSRAIGTIHSQQSTVTANSPTPTRKPAIDTRSQTDENGPTEESCL